MDNFYFANDMGSVGDPDPEPYPDPHVLGLQDKILAKKKITKNDDNVPVGKL